MMNKRLYRFRILRAETQEIVAAEDEADNSEVWLVRIPLDPRKRSEQIKKLLVVSKSGSETFTALGSLYLVAKSQSSALALLTMAQGVIAERPRPEPARTSPASTGSRTDTASTTSRASAGKRAEPGANRGPDWGSSKDRKKEAGAPIPRAVWVVLGGLVACGLIIASVLIRPKAAEPTMRREGGGPGVIAIADLTPSATIHYTTDGSEPTASSPVYSGPIRGLASGTTVRAIAVAPGRANSKVASGYYTVPQDYLKAQAVFDQGRQQYNRSSFGRARASFKQACEGEVLEACDSLGVMYARGLGGPATETGARAVLDGACKKGSMASCVSLGNIEQAKHQFAAAREHYQEACDSRYAKGCEYVRRLR